MQLGAIAHFLTSLLGEIDLQLVGLLGSVGELDFRAVEDEEAIQVRLRLVAAFPALTQQLGLLGLQRSLRERGERAGRRLRDRAEQVRDELEVTSIAAIVL